MIKIYVNGLPHICLKQSELIGYMSWITGEQTKLYHIDFYFNKTYFYSEYDTFEKFENILKLIDVNFNFDEKPLNSLIPNY